MDKPQKPTNLLPRSFGGQKEAFDTDKIANGYQPDVPDILGGANLNYTLDTMGKELEYTETIADFVNGLPINNVITTDENNKLIYINKSNLGYADANLTNLTPAGEKHFLNKTQVTNSILEAPEHIKLALSGGNLVLKAGSVVSIPNGFEEDGTTLHFDHVEIENDLTLASYNGTYTEYVSVNPSIGLNSANTNKCFSSATAPTFTGVGLWYDLQNNLLKYSSDSGTTWTSGFSMPLCLCGVVNNVRSSIDEIFNVIGCIGNTLWASKGLKILAPNGRNADGSLKNIEYTLSSDTSKELTSADTGLEVFFLRSLDNGQTWDIGYRSYGTQWYIQEEQPQVEHCEWYNPKTNLWKHCVSGEWSDILICPLGRVSCNEGQIISLYNYETTDLLKRSDRGEIIEWDRPNLTQSAWQLKAYNTLYIAEEDGWVYFNTHLRANANVFNNGSSGIQVYGIIDEINVYGHMVNTSWDGSGNTVTVANMHTLITKVYKGQTYKIYTHYLGTGATVVSYQLAFIPLAKKGA